MQLFKALVHYHLRENQWKTAITCCDDESKKGKDPYISFYRSIASFKQNTIIDAIRDVKQAAINKEFRYSSTCALIYYYEKSPTRDEQELSNLYQQQDKLKNDGKAFLAADIVNCMKFYFYMNDLDKFYDCEDLLENYNLKTTDGEDLIIKGWNLCYSDNPEEISSGNDFFTKYIEEFGANNIDAVMGGFKCLERLKKNEDVLDSFSAVSGLFKTFPPLMIEKAKIFLNLSEYDNAMDFIRSEVSCPHFEIRKILAICYLLNDGDYKLALENINAMWSSICSQEPNNPELYYNTAKLFSRICDRNEKIIELCDKMIDKAISFNIKNSNYLIEKGYYRFILNDHIQAENCYLKASEINPVNKESRIKLSLIMIKNNEIAKAKKEIDDLKDYYKQGNLPSPAELLFADLVLQEKIFLNSSECTSETALNIIEERFSPMLSEILNSHINYAKQFYFNKYDILVNTNYDFLCDLAKQGLEFFHINNNTLKIDSNNLPSIIAKSKKILDSILKNKYFVSAFLLNAKLKYLISDKAAAKQSLESIIKTDSTNLDAYILYIMLNNENRDYRKSKELVNDALLNCQKKAKQSINFYIAKIHMELGLDDLTNAENSLNIALKLIEEQSNNIKTNKDINKDLYQSILFEFKKSDKYVLMKLQIHILLKQEKIKEAQELINELVAENPNLGDDVLLLNADIAVRNKDFKKAVSLLKKIKPEKEKEELYIDSRVKLADIYLSSLIDRRLYSWCYSQIVEHFKTLDNLKLAANAEMQIDSPDRAILYYREALNINPNDEILIRDLGRALVLTHDYSSAISYYEGTLNNVYDKLTDKNVVTYYEIVEDYVKILNKLAIDDISKNLDLITLLDSFISLLRKFMTKYPDVYQLKLKLAFLLFSLSNTSRKLKTNIPVSDQEEAFSSIENHKALINNSIKHLEEAIRLVKEVNLKLRDKSQEDKVKANKNFLSEISYEQGLYNQYIEMKLELSEKSYLDSLSYSENTSEKALKKIINVELQLKKLAEASKYAEMLIRLNENSEDNISLLVTVISNKKNNEAACQYLEEIINKQHTSFKLIEVYIELIRRVGRINKVKEFITKCEKKLKFTYSPGLNFCKGLYYRYSNQTNLALQEFSKIKTDEYYGVKCIEQMLELYINPDNNILMLELISPYLSKKNKKNGVLEYTTSDINFEAVKFLLKELLIKKDDDRSRLYECWVSLLIRDEEFIIKAIQKLKDIIGRNPENISAWVLLSLANLILNNETEAKTNLKVIENSSVNNIKYYNDVERGYLILAYIAMRQDSIPKANEYLKKVIDINMAQVKAYEFYGMMYENTANYKEACNFFEKAWEFCSYNSAVIGYKLAICYLNNRNSIKAVNICNEVLKRFPDYPITDLALKAKNMIS